MEGGSQAFRELTTHEEVDGDPHAVLVAQTDREALELPPIVPGALGNAIDGALKYTSIGVSRLPRQIGTEIAQREWQQIAGRLSGMRKWPPALGRQQEGGRPQGPGF